MYTLCGHCHTTHEVSPEALASGRGRLHCQNCGEEFDALEYLSGEPPTVKADAPTPSADAQRQETLDFDAVITTTASLEHKPALASPPLTRLVDSKDTLDSIETPSEDRPVDQDASVDFTDDAFSADTAMQDAADDDDGAALSTPTLTDSTLEDEYADDIAARTDLFDADTDDDADADDDDLVDPTAEDSLDESPEASAAPSFIPTPPQALQRNPGAMRAWPRWLLVAGLALLLLVQSIVSERAHLAADANWRPWLERACNSLGCSLPTWHDPSAMHILTRDVRPHPSVDGALMISTSFRNDARWTQHWPTLELTLSGLDGETIASRAFRPAEYLGPGATERTIEAGQTASITLEVRDPGKQAMAFEFDFH